MNIHGASVLKGIVLLLFTVLIASCSNDDENKKNGEVNTSIELSSTAALQGRLIIDDAVLNVQQLNLAAVSLSKNTLRITKDLSQSDQAFVLTGRSLTAPVLLQAKKDRYNPLTIEVITTSDPYKPVFTDVGGIQTLDYSDFRLNSRPALLVTGSYETRTGTIPVVLAVSQILPLQVNATQNADPTVEIGVGNLAEIKLNPAVWFEEITTQMLDEAARVTFENRDIIFIHQQFNTNLYNKILLKLETPERAMSLNMTITRTQE